MKSKLPNMLSWVSSLVNLIIVFIISLACFHSFEFSDESFYFLGYYNHTNLTELGGSPFHIIYSKFFSFFNFTLPQVRLLRLFLTLASSGIVFAGIKPFIAFKSNNHKIIVFNLIITSTLLSYTLLPLALSYNSISSIFFNLVIGFSLLLVSEKKLRLQFLFSIAIGYLATLLLFNKITNVLIVPFLGLYLLLAHKNKAINITNIFTFLFRTIGFFLIGALISLWMYSGKLTAMFPTLIDLIEASLHTVDNDPSHSLGHLYYSYYINIDMIVRKLAYPSLILTLSFLALHFFPKIKSKLHLPQAYSIHIISFVLFVFIIVHNKCWKGGYGNEYKILIPYLFIFYYLLLNHIFSKRKINIILIVTLLFIPLIGSFGTNNGLSAQVLLYGTPILLALYYFIYNLDNTILRVSILGSIFILSLSQITTANLLFPYRQQNIFHCKYKIPNNKGLKGLKVSQETIDLLNNLSFLEKSKANHVFVYSHQFGIPMLLNKKPYTLAWLNDKSTFKTCEAIRESEIKADDIIFIIPSNKPFNSEIINCLHENNIDFENSFSLSKEITYLNPVNKKETQLSIFEYSNKK